MNFLNLAHNTITIRVRHANFKLRYLKTTLGTFFEKTIHGRGSKLGSYVPLMSLNKPKSEIFEKIFFSIFMGKMYIHIANFGHFCHIFFP